MCVSVPPNICQYRCRQQGQWLPPALRSGPSNCDAIGNDLPCAVGAGSHLHRQGFIPVSKDSFDNDDDLLGHMTAVVTRLWVGIVLHHTPIRLPVRPEQHRPAPSLPTPATTAGTAPAAG